MSTDRDLLELADELEWPGHLQPGVHKDAAAKLRRLHGEVLNLDCIASELQDTCHKQAKRIAEQDALLRQALEYITGDDEGTALDPNAIEQASKLITAIRQHLEGKQ